ncbi:MAG: hypothetical protein ACYTGQ_05085 [Planctomycetota bacterium]|jgi:hypothetical protein
MTTPPPRTRLLVIAMLVIATACATGLSWVELDAARSRAQGATGDTYHIRAIIGQLQSNRPDRSETFAEGPIADLPKTIADAAEGAGVFDKVTSDPITASDSRSTRSNTHVTEGRAVSVQNTTLQQLTDFLYRVTDTHPALSVSVLTLEASIPTPSTEERWNANANITYSRPVEPDTRP